MFFRINEFFGCKSIADDADNEGGDFFPYSHDQQGESKSKVRQHEPLNADSGAGGLAPIERCLHEVAFLKGVIRSSCGSSSNYILR